MTATDGRTLGIPLTAADLTALPTGSVVRYATERGMRPAVALKTGGYGPDRDKWHSSDSMAPVTSFIIASNNPILLTTAEPAHEPGTSRERSAHDAAAVEAACAWSDYRKDYGVSVDRSVRDLEHKAFMAGRQSALGTLDTGGVQR